MNADERGLKPFCLSALIRVYQRLVCVFLCSALFAAGDTAAGIQAFRDGRYSVALRELKNARDENGRTFYALAQAASGDCKGALPVLIRAQGRLTAIAAVKCYSAAGDEADAYRLLDSLSRQFPGDPDVIYTAAKLHMKGFNDATLQMFERAPASYRVHELSAEIFEVENRYQEAAAEYQKAIDLNPLAADLHYRLGRAVLLQGHDPQSLDRAAEEFRAELKVSPEDSACEFQLGQLAMVKGNSVDAEANFKRALQLTPSFGQASIALAKLYVRQKRYEDAIGLLKGVVRWQPQNETAHYTLMTAYRDAGQMDKAKDEKAILDKLQKPPEGEFSDFLKKLGEKPPAQ